MFEIDYFSTFTSIIQKTFSTIYLRNSAPLFACHAELNLRLDPRPQRMTDGEEGQPTLRPIFERLIVVLVFLLPPSPLLSSHAPWMRSPPRLSMGPSTVLVLPSSNSLSLSLHFSLSLSLCIQYIKREKEKERENVFVCECK